MALALTFLWISLIELSSFIFMDAYSLYIVVSDVCSLHSIYLCHIPCMIRQVILVPQHRLQYSNVCSSTISVDPEGWGSTGY
jgi:hypothetical protein